MAECSVASAQQLNMGDMLPQDTNVRVGKLDNGMGYYLRHNAKSTGLADFYIVYDVGAVQEEDSQNGLAHFLEHMMFNGTKYDPVAGEYRDAVRDELERRDGDGDDVLPVDASSAQA